MLPGRRQKRITADIPSVLCVIDISLLIVITTFQFEKAKQDDALDDLSDLLGELKNMAVDMGSEIGRSVLCNIMFYL